METMSQQVIDYISQPINTDKLLIRLTVLVSGETF